MINPPGLGCKLRRHHTKSYCADSGIQPPCTKYGVVHTQMSSHSFQNLMNYRATKIQKSRRIYRKRLTVDAKKCLTFIEISLNAEKPSDFLLSAISNLIIV